MLASMAALCVPRPTLPNVVSARVTASTTSGGRVIDVAAQSK